MQITFIIWMIFIALCGAPLFFSGNAGIAAMRALNIPIALFTLIMGYLHLHQNPLSSFFVMIAGFSFLMVSIFSLNYYKQYSLAQQKKIQLFQTLFVFSLLLVFVSDTMMTFLFAWEMMTFTSYFLVASIEPDKTTRKAGLLYLGMAHVGLFFIAMAFFIVFSTHALSLSPMDASAVFIFILIGFGMKAGLFPGHVWLPEAHPSAPSPISALMSGVMLTTAIYGFILFLFHFLLSYQQTWWGYTLICLGLITMFVGVIQATVATEIKRLLAYSSMENMGFVTVTLGLGIIFYQNQQYFLLDLTLLIALLHCLNHAVFKTLLFLISGSILHATHEKNLNRLGGLIRVMPGISVCALIGVLSMAGLPLLNGFVSEWLYLSIFFYHAPHHFALAALSPLIIALSVFVFSLSAFVAVKFFGAVFLGQARTAVNHNYHESKSERIALGILAFSCVALGIFPNGIISCIQTLLKKWLPILHHSITTGIFLQLNAAAKTSGSGFSPTIVMLSLLLLVMIIYFLLKIFSFSKIRRTIPWSCGFEKVNTPTQDSASGLSQPFLRIFSPWFIIKKYHHSLRLTEMTWEKCYVPLRKNIIRLSIATKWFQQGRITTYLLYIGITLLLLFVGILWL